MTGPEDAMQFYLVPELGGYDNIVTAMQLFSRYMFFYSRTSQDAETISRVIFNILTKHANLPTQSFPKKDQSFYLKW